MPLAVTHIPFPLKAYLLFFFFPKYNKTKRILIIKSWILALKGFESTWEPKPKTPHPSIHKKQTTSRSWFGAARWFSWTPGSLARAWVRGVWVGLGLRLFYIFFIVIQKRLPERGIYGLSVPTALGRSQLFLQWKKQKKFFILSRRQKNIIIIQQRLKL